VLSLLLPLIDKAVHVNIVLSFQHILCDYCVSLLQGQHVNLAGEFSVMSDFLGRAKQGLIFCSCPLLIFWPPELIDGERSGSPIVFIP